MGMAEGYIFLAPYERVANSTAYDPHLLIVDNQGEIVYYATQSYANQDFKKQQNGFLSATQGFYKHQILDSAYRLTSTIRAANGYNSDFHDLQILPNGERLILIFEERRIDMSEVVEGGDPSAIVVGCRVQALDATQQLVFEWSSFDHFALEDSTSDLTVSRVDYVHCNAIEQDTDGNLLLSSRDMNEITKINRQTGEIMWRLGGKQNQFTFINAIGAEAVRFARQHDARRTPQGTLLMFDNRLGVSNYSRAAEYQLDEEAHLATLVWEYRHEPDVFGHIMGNAQRLPNGNTLIGWGSGIPAVTEVTPAGEVVFELYLPENMQSYRAFRFPWEGHPVTEPTLVVDDSQGDTITLSYSWNGATEVIGYRVYGDTNPTPTTLLQTTRKTGFESHLTLSNMVDGPYYFRVEPLLRGVFTFTEHYLPRIGHK